MARPVPAGAHGRARPLHGRGHLPARPGGSTEKKQHGTWLS
ncbi:hypothetical protein SXCC_02472 [Gluconacetobacter sp. SXCC-1]|nr:hypothetical protein SXCC_02472 [Gluconacetobacter sp. SXCC-1]